MENHLRRIGYILLPADQIGSKAHNPGFFKRIHFTTFGSSCFALQKPLLLLARLTIGKVIKCLMHISIQTKPRGTHSCP